MCYKVHSFICVTKSHICHNVHYKVVTVVTCCSSDIFLSPLLGIGHAWFMTLGMVLGSLALFIVIKVQTTKL